MRRAARIDGTHAEVVETLRKCGWTVHDTSRLGGGFPDVVASRAGIVRLVEIKTAKGKLRPLQVQFASQHPVIVVRGAEDAAALR